MAADGFLQRAAALPRLGLGLSTEYGASRADGALDPNAMRREHPELARFLEVGVEIAKGLDAPATAWAQRPAHSNRNTLAARRVIPAGVRDGPAPVNARHFVNEPRKEYRSALLGPGLDCLPTPDASDHGSMRRVIGPLGALSIVAGSMLGVGIFVSPPVVAQLLNEPWAFFAVWVLGGLFALAGASAYAELGARYPRAGGDYVYVLNDDKTVSQRNVTRGQGTPERVVITSGLQPGEQVLHFAYMRRQPGLLMQLLLVGGLLYLVSRRTART